MSSIFAVKLCHESFVGVSDHEDAGVQGFDLLPAALMRLDADGPPTSPVVSLPLKSFIIKGAIKVIAARVEASGELYEVASPGVASSGETGEGHQLLGMSGEEMSVHAAVI